MMVGALALAALAVAGCSSESDIQQLNQNQFTLRGMIANDRQQIDALEQQVRALKDQVTELSHNGGGGGGGDRQLASINDRVNKIEAQVSGLQGGLGGEPGGGAGADGGGGGDRQLASINDRLNKIEAQVSGLQAGMSAAPAVGAVPAVPGVPAAPGVPGAAAVASATSSISPPPAAPAAEPQPTWPQDLDQEIAAAADSKESGIKSYRAGLEAMKAGKYPVAIARFTELTHHYPKSPLVTPAEYFTANALYESGKYDQAILQFNDVVMRDPKGKYASQALLREAQSFMKLNDKIDARLTLQKLLADHGDSPEATAANAMMKTLVAD